MRTTAPTAISTSYCHCCMSVFLWPLLQTDLYPVTHPVPFHNGSVSGNPVTLRQVRTHATPPVGRLWAVTLPTSFHNGSVSRDLVPLWITDGITIRPIVPVKRAITGCSCHNGSNSRDSMPLRYRAKRKRLQKRLPQDATKMQNFCTALGFCAIWTTPTYTGAPRLCKSNKFICTALGFLVYLRHEK